MPMFTMRVWLFPGWEAALKKARVDFDPKKVQAALYGEHYLEFSSDSSPLLRRLPPEVVESCSLRAVRPGNSLKDGAYHKGAALGTVLTERSARGDTQQVVTVVGPFFVETVQHFWRIVGGVAEHDAPEAKKIIPLRKAAAAAEREAIIRALRLCDGCRTTAAQKLRINRTTLFNKMRRYGLLQHHWEELPTS